MFASARLFSRVEVGVGADALGRLDDFETGLLHAKPDADKRFTWGRQQEIFKKNNNERDVTRVHACARRMLREKSPGRYARRRVRPKDTSREDATARVSGRSGCSRQRLGHDLSVRGKAADRAASREPHTFWLAPLNPNGTRAAPGTPSLERTRRERLVRGTRTIDGVCSGNATRLVRVFLALERSRCSFGRGRRRRARAPRRPDLGGIDIRVSFLTRISVVSCPIWTMESVLKCHRTLATCLSHRWFLIGIRLNHALNSTRK